MVHTQLVTRRAARGCSGFAMCSAAPSRLDLLWIGDSWMLPKASCLLSAGGRAAFIPLGWGALRGCSLRRLLGKHTQPHQNLQDRRNVGERDRCNFVHHEDMPIVVHRSLPNVGNDDQGIHWFRGPACSQSLVLHVFHRAIRSQLSYCFNIGMLWSTVLLR